MGEKFRLEPALAAALRRPYNPQMDRMIGILGGMGPEATLDLYDRIIRLVPARKDQDHPRVLIYSNPKIPDRTLAILVEGPSPLEALVESARVLERAGAGIIAIPCNASHHFLPEIAPRIGIPILDMIGETCRRVVKRRPPLKRVGLLAASGTVLGRVYHRTLESAGLRVLVPGAPGQERLHRAIMQVKAGAHDASTREIFHRAGRSLVRRGAQAVILGCTEIPLAFDPEAAGYPTFDATEILAEAAVDWALGKEGGGA